MGGWIFEVEQGAEMGISFLIVLHGIIGIRRKLPFEGGAWLTSFGAARGVKSGGKP